MKYTAPEMNIVKFEAMEVIVASGDNTCPVYNLDVTPEDPEV